MTQLLIACIQVSADYCARIIFPADSARGSVSHSSMRGDPITQHQRAGHDWVFVHAWSEPGWKNGKEPKKPWEVNNAKCLSAGPDAAWRMERTGLRPDSTVERRYIDIPQSVRPAADRTRAQTQSKISKSAVAPLWERIKYALVKGKSIGVGGKRKQGP